MPQASIIIRALNEGRFLPETLEALAAQTLRDFEVILVDSGSTDDTVAIAERHEARLVRIDKEQFTYGRALNLGCGHARAPIAVLLSAHACPAHERWLQALLEPFASQDIAGVMGRELPRRDCNPFDRRGLLRRYANAAPHDLSLNGSGGIGFGAANSAIRLEVWKELPFDEELTYAEDFDWGRKVLASGRRLFYQPEAPAYHSHNETLSQVRRRYHNEAAAARRLQLSESENWLSRYLLTSTALPFYDMAQVISQKASPRWLFVAPFRRWAMSFGRYTGYRGIDPEAGACEATAGRAATSLVLRANRFLSDRSPAMVRWTGKSKHALHPKHLLKSNVDRDWYVPHIEPGMTVLDAGCGHGAHAMAGARAGARVVGFDQNTGQLALGLRRLRETGAEQVSFQTADAERDWPYRTRSFQRVLALDILEHIHERRHFLSECRRVLAPEGKLLLAVPNRGTAWRKRLARLGLPSYSDPDHKIEYTREELEDELRSAGFRIEACAPVVFDTPWFGLIDMTGGISMSLYAKLADWKRQAALREPEQSNGFRVVATPS